MQLNEAQQNHLRRLLGWVACEIGQAPDDMVQMVRDMAPKLGQISDEGKARLVQHHAEACNVPQYVRQAVKQLRKAMEATTQPGPGETTCASATKSADLSLPRIQTARSTAQEPPQQLPPPVLSPCDC